MNISLKFESHSGSQVQWIQITRFLWEFNLIEVQVGRQFSMLKKFGFIKRTLAQYDQDHLKFEEGLMRKIFCSFVWVDEDGYSEKFF